MAKKQAEDKQIQLAQSQYESAVNMFAAAKNQIDTANAVLDDTEMSIEDQIAALVAKKNAITEQKERNSKFGKKLEEFLG